MRVHLEYRKGLSLQSHPVSFPIRLGLTRSDTCLSWDVHGHLEMPSGQALMPNMGRPRSSPYRTNTPLWLNT